MTLTKEKLIALIRAEIASIMSERDDEEILDEGPLDSPYPSREEMRKTCASRGFYELPRLLKTMNDISLAGSGKLPPTGKSAKK